jgi:hypothetical protein
MNCKFFNVTSKALCFQLSFIIFFMLLTFHQLEAQDEKAQKVGPGIVKEHSRGLHGYISYNADKPADQSSYSYGMGFYSAVWPLITQPVPGLRPTTPIIKTNPLHPLERLPVTIGQNEAQLGVVFFKPSKVALVIGPEIDFVMVRQNSV